MYMTSLTEKEATLLMHSYGIKCDRELVKAWLCEGKIKGTERNGVYSVKEDEVYNFLESYRWEGTSYEKGIDNQTKIARLLDEVNDYRKRIEELEKKNSELKNQLGFMPF